MILTGIIFFFSEIHTASQKKFWTDETVGINNAITPKSYSQLIINGPPGEASPSPLYYVILRFLDHHKNQTNIPKLIYFRLPGILITLAVAWLICIILWQEIRKNNIDISTKIIQYILLMAIPFRFLFEEDVYYYAMESRVYALWNSLWFLCLFFTFNDRYTKYLIATLIILAFTATGISFQIVALIFAYIIIKIMEGETLKNISLNSIKIFFIPLCIIFYYGIKVPSFNYTEEMWGTWQVFFSFWQENSRKFYFIIFTAILCLIKKETRKFCIIPLTMIILLLLGPVIYHITRAKGCFMTNRQYIYYHLAKVLGILTFIKLIPYYVKQKTPKLSIIYSIIFISIGLGFTINNKAILAFAEGIKNAFLPG
ncbi:MAG: hypothetical protein HQL25_04585 [Candidatus Omnitrophica bacterium]|nr:hypothetical protein [Candidatus Omnitrophota bacterium]